ncbi:Pyruvate formate lyase [Megamonas hypermegale ART12/1]|nr:Pyruvate formate lyase [Megamonas hypermegale ART12/1]
MSIYIEDKTLIVGNQATKNKNAPIFPEYTMEFVLNELDLFKKEMVMFLYHRRNKTAIERYSSILGK